MKKAIVLMVIGMAAATVSLSAAEAKETYDKQCAKCHGADGKGETKMGKKVGCKDLTDAKVQAGFTDEKATKSIKEGVKEGGKTLMKAFGEDLSDAEIKGLVAYIRAFKK